VEYRNLVEARKIWLARLKADPDAAVSQLVIENEA
jgi:hypothetical protein